MRAQVSFSVSSSYFFAFLLCLLLGEKVRSLVLLMACFLFFGVKDGPSTRTLVHNTSYVRLRTLHTNEHIPTVPYLVSRTVRTGTRGVSNTHSLCTPNIRYRYPTTLGRQETYECHYIIKKGNCTEIRLL